MGKHHYLLLVFLLTFGIAQAGEQVVAVQPSNINVGYGETVTVDVEYTTENPQDSTLTSLGVRLHWNATELIFQNLPSFLASELVGQEMPEPDANDFDAHPSTDTLIYLAWADLDSSWPDLGSAPVDLFTVEFVAPFYPNQITSSLNVSSSTTAANYSFIAGTSIVSTDCTGSHISGKNLVCSSLATSYWD